MGQKVVYDMHRIMPRPYGTSVQFPDFAGAVCALFKMLENLSCRCFDLVLVVTDELSQSLPGNVHTIKNYPHFLYPPFAASRGQLKLVYVGLISQARGSSV